MALLRMKTARIILGVVVAAGGALFLAGGFHALEVRRLSAKVSQLELDRQRLRDYADRLSASRRVAQADIVGQVRDAAGRTVSDIVWHEIGPGGVLAPPKSLEVVGDLVYFEAAVIKFDHRLVGEGDPDHGSSLALFHRIFGEHQPAAAAVELNGALEDRLKQSDDFDARLWSLFWRMMDDPALAARYGVRVAQCEAPAVRVKAGQIWEVTLDAAGGLNVKLIRDRTDAASLSRPTAVPSA